VSRKKALVVDDEHYVTELIQFTLENSNFDVLISDNGEDAIRIAEEHTPDVIILDLMLPGIDGFEVCKRIRNSERSGKIPIIMLTAKGEEVDKILGLELGADDYLTKPFSVRELLARIKAILRRLDDIPNRKARTIKIHDIFIDTAKHEVYKNENLIELTLKEFKLLLILAENRGKVLSRNLLLTEIWGDAYSRETRTVDVHVRYLRMKIEDNDRHPMYIETIRGVGYRMK
jgi:two-component system alkaline phosphatase synthesis response regulator PhoP